MSRECTIQGGKRLGLHGLRGSSAAYYLAELNKPAVVVSADPAAFTSWCDNYLSFKPDAFVYTLPPLDGSPFAFSPVHAAVRRARLQALDALKTGEWDLLIVHPMALLQPLAPFEHLVAPKLHLRVGHDYEYEAHPTNGSPDFSLARDSIL